VEKTNLDLILSHIDPLSLVTMSKSSENTILRDNQNTTVENYSNIDENISQNYVKEESFKQGHSMSVDSSVPETNNPKARGLNKVSKQASKKGKRKLGFLQMRIDSTIYFDNMGYSYQIQNEKNDKK